MNPPKEERPRGLGRGLSALIGDDVAPLRGDAVPKATRTLPVAFLKPGRFQPRKHFASEALSDQWVAWEHVQDLPPLIRVLVERGGAGTAVRLMRRYAFERFLYNVRRDAHRDEILALPPAAALTLPETLQPHATGAP